MLFGNSVPDETNSNSNRVDFVNPGTSISFATESSPASNVVIGLATPAIRTFTVPATFDPVGFA